MSCSTIEPENQQDRDFIVPDGPLGEEHYMHDDDGFPYLLGGDGEPYCPSGLTPPPVRHQLTQLEAEQLVRDGFDEGKPDRPAYVPPMSSPTQAQSPPPAKEPPKKRARPSGGPYLFRWCFTLNNPGIFRPKDKECIAYMVYSLEAGKNGTPHLQGYVRFTVKKRLSAVMSTWESTPMDGEAHWEPAQGSEQENKEYCTKEATHIDGPWEIKPENFKPDSGKQGHRSDLEPVCSAVKNGASIHSVAADFPNQFVKYHSGIAQLIQLVGPKPPMERQIEVIVLWGPTNTGKSHRCWSNYPDLYLVTPGRDPWGRYSGQQTILFDEFKPSAWTLQDMNRYMDKWPCSLDCRYYDKFAAWTRVLICANSSPTSWYPMEDYQLQNAFFRRITACFHVTKRMDDPEADLHQLPEPIEPIPDPVQIRQWVNFTH